MYFLKGLKNPLSPKIKLLSIGSRHQFQLVCQNSLAGEPIQQEYIFEKTPEHLIESTKDFWQAWTGQVEVSFTGL